MQTIRPLPKLTSLNTPAVLRLGELLIKEGFIQNSDLKRALEVQTRGAEEAVLPLGRLMVKKQMIDKQDLERLLRHPDLRKLLGTLLLDANFITQQALETALELKPPNERLGQLLVRRGAIDASQLAPLLERQKKSLKIGELANSLGMISNADLDRVVRIKSGHRPIGEILCDLDKISVEDLHYILPKYGKDLKLGDILIKQGLLTERQLEDALQDQHHIRKKIGQILMDQSVITVDQLYAALSRQFNVPYRSLDGFEFDSRNLRMLAGVVGEKQARTHRMLPLSLKEDRLQIGVTCLEDKSSIAGLVTLYPDLKVEPVLIRRKKFRDLYGALYGMPSGNKSKKAAEGIQDLEVMDLDLREDDLSEESVKVDEMTAEQVVDYIIRLGISKGASDIHIEQDRQGARLRFRTDGTCREVEIGWLNAKLQEMPHAIIASIKVLAAMDSAEHHLPQDGVFRVNFYDQDQDRRFDLDFRVATCPAIVGENVTIRILDSRKAKLGLETLNHSPHVLEPLKKMIKRTVGMILVAGPTGSGKSSTLYGSLHHIYHPGIKIITAEDPIEYSFPGIMQTQIKPKIGLNFSRLLRSFLRSDPDVILVGEISDPETAVISFDAAQTGHLLLSSVNTNDAVSAVSQLLDLDIGIGQIATGLIGVIAQRLVRKTCAKCKLEYKPLKEEWAPLFKEYPKHLKFYKGMGCKSCGYSGYKGKTLISELFEIDRKTASAMSNGANTTQIRQLALSKGMKTMIDDGLLKMNQITLSEIIRVVPMDMIKAFVSRDGKPSPPAISLKGEMPRSFREQLEIELGNPANEMATVDNLFERYQIMRQNAGRETAESDIDLFRKFVGNTYKKVTDKHGCRRVHFEFISQNGEIKITATPAGEALDLK